MEKAKVLGISALVALVVAGGFYLLAPRPEKEVVREVIREIAQEPLGAIPGTEITGNEITVGEITTWYGKQAFRTGSSTNILCAIPVPYAASSTLMEAYAVVQGKSTSTATQGIGIYKSANMTATTTRLVLTNFTATGTVVSINNASTTNADRLLGGIAEKYVVFDYQGAWNPYLSVNGNTGYCAIVVRKN